MKCFLPVQPASPFLYFSCSNQYNIFLHGPHFSLYQLPFALDWRSPMLFSSCEPAASRLQQTVYHLGLGFIFADHLRPVLFIPLPSFHYYVISNQNCLTQYYFNAL